MRCGLKASVNSSQSDQYKLFVFKGEQKSLFWSLKIKEKRKGLWENIKKTTQK